MYTSQFEAECMLLISHKPIDELWNKGGDNHSGVN